jgi:hypothetical protein
MIKMILGWGWDSAARSNMLRQIYKRFILTNMWNYVSAGMAFSAGTAIV